MRFVTLIAANNSTWCFVRKLVWCSSHPISYSVPQDNSLYYTMGFLILGLVWAVFVLLRNDMRPNRMLGTGLVGIYLVFLFVRLTGAMGIVSLAGLSKL